jgi:hypothetical protein
MYYVQHFFFSMLSIYENVGKPYLLMSQHAVYGQNIEHKKQRKLKYIVKDFILLGE